MDLVVEWFGRVGPIPPSWHRNVRSYEAYPCRRYDRSAFDRRTVARVINLDRVPNSYHNNGMSYTIGMDAAGRLVLPKAVREQYGIANGAHQLEVSDTSDGIVLRPKGATAALVREAGGWMVFQADEEASADSIDPVAVVDEARSARSRVVTGEA